MAKKTRKDVEIGVAVTKKGNGAKQANRELKKLENGFKQTAKQASRLTITNRALEAKQKQLGKAVAKGERTVKSAAKEYQKFADKLNKTAKAAQGATDSQEKNSSILETAKANWMALAGGVVAAGVAIKTAKELFDFAAEGAAIQQLEESFERLNETTFKTPNLLNDMTEATRGTVSPMKLMKGVMTLTAGASDDMAKRFAEASPKLAEIAKAAQKLNPTLGDTAFLYDSIATGIKRSSPLILDNLGIVVKIGKANEDYAAQLGKSVEELTAMEKQTALLNATIKAGDQLINQVGGDVGSTMDKYAQLTTAVDILKDGMASLAADALGPVVGYFADLLIQAKDAKELREFSRVAKDIALDLIELRKEAQAANEVVDDLLDTWRRLYLENIENAGGGFQLLGDLPELDLKLLEEFGRLLEANEDWTVNEAFVVSIQNMEQSLRNIEAVELHFDRMAGEAEDFTKEISEWDPAINAATEQAQLLELKLMDVGTQAHDAIREMRNMGLENAAFDREDEERNLKITPDERRAVTKVNAEIQRQLDNQVKRQEELDKRVVKTAEELEKEADEAAKAADEIAQMVRELEKAARVRFSTGATQQLKNLSAAAEAGTEVTQNLNNVMFESATAAGVDGLAYLELARSTGLYTEEQIRAAIRMEAMKIKAEDLGRAIADGAISVSDAIQELEDFNAELDRVPTRKTIDFVFNLPPIPDILQEMISQELSVPVTVDPTRPSGSGIPGHSGLSGIVPSGFPNDSFPIMVESGERVLVQTKAQQRAGVDTHGNPIGGRSGGTTKIMHSSESNVFNVPDQSTARFVAHQIDEARRQRYENFMGKG